MSDGVVFPEVDEMVVNIDDGDVIDGFSTRSIELLSDGKIMGGSGGTAFADLLPGSDYYLSRIEFFTLSDGPQAGDLAGMRVTYTAAGLGIDPGAHDPVNQRVGDIRGAGAGGQCWLGSVEAAGSLDVRDPDRILWMFIYAKGQPEKRIISGLTFSVLSDDKPAGQNWSWHRFGDQDPRNFLGLTVVPPGHEIVGLEGSSGEVIDRIGAVVGTIPTWSAPESPSSSRDSPTSDRTPGDPTKKH